MLLIFCNVLFIPVLCLRRSVKSAGMADMCSYGKAGGTFSIGLFIAILSKLLRFDVTVHDFVFTWIYLTIFLAVFIGANYCVIPSFVSGLYGLCILLEINAVCKVKLFLWRAHASSQVCYRQSFTCAALHPCYAQ